MFVDQLRTISKSFLIESDSKKRHFNHIKRGLKRYCCYKQIIYENL